MGGGDSSFEAREGGLYDSENESLILQGRWIPATDGVPMVGDHQAVKDYAEALTTQAGDIRDYMDQIQQLEPDWEGDAADRFVELKATLPPQMEMVAERLETVAGALDTYADSLKDAQDDAGGAAQAARDAETELEDANSDRSDAEDNLEQWEADHPEETFDWSGHDTAVSDAETKLLDAWADFKQAYEDRWTAAETCTEAIETAISDTGDTGILNDAPREQASDDAEQLQSLLDELGVDAADFDPWLELRDLDPDDPEYMELYELLQEMGDRYDEGAYSEVLFNELGADGIHAILGTMEMMQSHSQSGQQDPPLDVEDELLMPFLNGFASATDDMDADILADLTDVEDDWWKLPQLGLLLGGDGELYDPDFLADAADVVLVSEADEWSEVTWGYHPPSAEAGGQLWDTMALNSPHLNAYNALTDNPEASWLFADKGDDNLNALLHPDTTQAVQTAGAQGVLTHETVEAEVEQAAGNAFTAAFVDAPLADEGIYHDALELYPEVVRAVGEDEVPDAIRRAVAESTGPYLGDIGNVAYHATGESGADEAITDDYRRPDVVAFFHEIGKDEEAAQFLGEQIRSWAGFRLGNTPEVTLPSNAVEGNGETADILIALTPVAQVVGAAHTAFQEPESEEFNAFAFGLSSGTSSATGAWRAFSAFSSAHPTAAAGSYLVNNLGDGLAAWMENDSDDPVMEVNPTEFRDDLVAELRQGHVAYLEDQGVADELIERGLLEPKERYPTEQEYRQRLLVLSYGTEPYADLDEQIVGRAFDRDADQSW